MSSISALVLLALCAADADTVLVQFHSTKCGPCRAMHPVVQRLADSGYPLQQVDVDAQPQYAEQFQIRSLPTFALFARGREVRRVEGPSNFNELADLFHTVGYRPSAPQPAQGSQGEIQYTSAPAAANAEPANPTQTHFAQAPVAEMPRQAAPNNTAFVSAPAPPTAAAANSVSPQQRAAWATVRLKVEDNSGFGFGTGTIIDRHDDEALVLTCGHIFRQSQGKGKITVDLFAPGATQPIEGQLIAWHADERDIALVSIRPTVAIEPVTVAPPGYAVAARDRVFTIGCDKGAAPSLRNSLITPNRIIGAPRFTAEGAPVEGRSGGGLFTETGLLIGVCNSASARDNVGLYAALPTVHWQLDEIGQAAIYKDKTPAGVSPAGFEQTVAQNPPMQPQPAQLQPVPAAVQQPSAPDRFAAGNTAAPNLPSTMPRTPVGAPLAATGAANQPAAHPDDSEVIVIVRSRSNPTKQSEIFMLDRPPAEVIRILQSDARLAPRGTSQDLLRSAARLGQPGLESAPVVRGQSQE